MNSNIKEVNEHINSLTNAVARLRELLNREAYDCGNTPCEFRDAEQYAKYILNHYDRNSEKDKLCLANDLLRRGWNSGQPNAPAPKEPVSTPTDLNHHNKENTLSLNEWRELGDDELICEGDEQMGTKDWYPFPPIAFGKLKKEYAWACRTRRPLPKQEEMPRDIEVLIDTIAFRGGRKGEGVFYCVADAIRYLRDEIQKLKAEK